MIKKLGNYSLLIGFFCLLIFFSSSAFLVDQAWFLLGGIGFIALGLLISRRRKLKSDRKNKFHLRRRRNREEYDEVS